MSSVLVETRMACMHFKTGTGPGIRALQDVSLSIEPGDFVLLSGPSGSGKTTVLALLGALARPTSGQVIFDGVDLGHCSDTKLTRIRRRIGFVFQQFSLIAGLPVWENITYPLIPLGVSRTERRGRAAELVAELGLKDKSHARPEELSGGEQQRVAIARALVNRPQLLLADEPTSNLDQAAGQSLLSKFKDIHQRGTCVVVSSHDPRMIPLATREFVMEAGRLKGAS